MYVQEHPLAFETRFIAEFFLLWLRDCMSISIVFVLMFSSIVRVLLP